MGNARGHSSVLFFPRPSKADWEGPKKYENREPSWLFGAFAMGGFFVQGDTGIYDALTHDDL